MARSGGPDLKDVSDDRVNMKTSTESDSRFRSDAGKYAAYLETAEGRLRLDLAFANLQEFLPVLQANNSLCALDLGCGTGAAAVRLALLGIHVTLLDSSLPMLEIAERAALEAGVSDKVTLKHTDANKFSSLFNAGTFDVILCHNLLEYVDDPSAVLCGVARVMRGPSAIFSVLVRNQAGEVLKRALKTGDVSAAENGLTAEWGVESLYGGRVRLFTSETLETLLKQVSLTMVCQRGVRVLADYLPPQISRTAEYERILALECKVGKRRDFAAIARYSQCLARRVTPLSEGAE
jgi:S-adenosylmethionine-dependent methyltransferase